MEELSENKVFVMEYPKYRNARMKLRKRIFRLRIKIDILAGKSISVQIDLLREIPHHFIHTRQNPSNARVLGNELDNLPGLFCNYNYNVNYNIENL